MNAQHHLLELPSTQGPLPYCDHSKSQSENYGMKNILDFSLSQSQVLLQTLVFFNYWYQYDSM